MEDIDVLKRAEWISKQNIIAAKLVMRRELPAIAEKATEMAKEGFIPAMKICFEQARSEDKEANKSEISPSSLEESLERAEIEYEKHAEMMTPTWLQERAKRLASGIPPVSAVSYVKPPEPNAEPAPEAAPANPCDACGKTRCVHGRCPMCDICEVCQ